MSPADPLLSRYSGSAAEAYDRKRSSSARFVAEEAAFAEFLGVVRPRGVLDCPFGTGRWLPHYRTMRGLIVGIDISPDMLSVAAAKLAEQPLPNLTLETADIFAQPFSPYGGRGIDLVVCTRFLNWVPAAKAAQALARLREVDAKHAVIGASVRPLDADWVQQLRMRWRLAVDNLKRRWAGQAQQYVHEETFLRSCFSRLGWDVIASRLIFVRSTRHNLFYLLKLRES